MVIPLLANQDLTPMLTDMAEISMWDPIKKRSLKLFSNWQKKAACKVKDKIIKLRKDRQLIARFLVIQKSRPNLSEMLNDVIATYEFSTIPRSFFSGDGEFLIPDDKSSFLKEIEPYQDSNETATPSTEVENSSLKRVCIIDAMAIGQSVKKGQICRFLQTLPKPL